VAESLITGEVEIYYWYAHGGMGGNDELVEQLICLRSNHGVSRVAQPSHTLANTLRARGVLVTERYATDAGLRVCLFLLVAWVGAVLSPLVLVANAAGVIIALPLSFVCEQRISR
jgi:hypothetical protein